MPATKKKDLHKKPEYIGEAVRFNGNPAMTAFVVALNREGVDARPI